MASTSTDEVWWHRRAVLVSDDSTWTSEMLDQAPAGTLVAEASTWTEAPRVAGPVGALVCHVDRPRAQGDTLIEAYERWSSLAWQPCTLTWLASRPGAARIRAVLDRHGFQVVCSSEFTLSRDDDGDPWDEVLARLDAAPWIVPFLVQRLNWSQDPRLVEILSSPVLDRDVATVRAGADASASAMANSPTCVASTAPAGPSGCSTWCGCPPRLGGYGPTASE